jgi:hypothetical protein
MQCERRLRLHEHAQHGTVQAGFLRIHVRKHQQNPAFRLKTARHARQVLRTTPHLSTTRTVNLYRQP